MHQSSVALFVIDHVLLLFIASGHLSAFAKMPLNALNQLAIADYQSLHRTMPSTL